MKQIHPRLSLGPLLIGASLLVALITCPAAAQAQAGPLDAAVLAELKGLERSLGTELLAAAQQALALDGVENTAAGIGALAITARHLELACWAYGSRVRAETKDAIALNNFGVCLHEMYLKNGSSSLSTITLAHELLTRAAAAEPMRSDFHSNLGYAAHELWKKTASAAQLKAAAAALAKAVSLNEKSATAWAHLADVLAAQGKPAEAARALARSRELSPTNGVMLSTLAGLNAATRTAYQAQRPQCKVDYQCNANCPRSIIGRVDRVSCEMAQSSAQMACQAGKPYARAYDCREKLPRWGILIPGLNQGFSLVTPWGRADVLVSNKGELTYRFKPTVQGGRLSPYLKAKGTWSPESGFSSVKLAGGISLNVLGGNPANKLSNQYGVGPASISPEVNFTGGHGQLKVEAYGNTILTH